MQPEEQEQSKTNKRIRLYTLSSLGTIVIAALLLWLLHWGINVSRDWNELQNAQAEEAPALKSQFDASLEIAKAIVSGIGTVATIAAGVVVYLNFRVANRQAETATEQARIANKQAKLAESRLITERFSKAIELLGAENGKVAIRLGGIYALEKIAEEAPEQYHWTVMDVLTSFIRSQSRIEESLEDVKRTALDDARQFPTRTREDIQAILTVIGRQHFDNGENRNLDISRTNLSGADLSGATLNGAFLIETDLNRADLSNATLIKADLRDSIFRGTTLSEADLSEANFESARFIKANLQKATLVNAKLRQVSFVNSTLSEAILTDADLFGAKLTGSYLTNAYLTRADLREVSLSGAILTKAILKGAELSGADFTNANLTYANFTGATGLTLEQVRSALNWDKAIYDEELRNQLGLTLDYDAEIRRELGLPKREGQE